jgi:carboxyl-terminal processing protease
MEALKELLWHANDSLAFKAPWLFAEKASLAVGLPKRIDDALGEAQKQLKGGEGEPEEIVQRAICYVAYQLKMIDGHSSTPLWSGAHTESSSLGDAAGGESFSTPDCPPAPELRIEHHSGLTIARLVVPECSAPSQEHSRSYYHQLRELIRSAEDSDVRGYIIDVRGNGGGNMFPMYGGLLPLLGSGKLSAFLTPPESSSGNPGDFSTWKRLCAKSNLELFADANQLTELQAELRQSNSELPIIRKPVALWQNEGTGSSGEQVLILFSGRDQTRRFGSPSSGLTTANIPLRLSKKPEFPIVIANAVTADRNNERYWGIVAPEETIDCSSEVPLAPGEAELREEAELLKRSAKWMRTLR